MRRTMFLALLRKWRRTLLRLLTMPHTFERETSNSLDIHTHMLSTPRCSFIHLWGQMPSLRRYTSLPVYPSARLSPLLSATDIRSSGSGTCHGPECSRSKRVTGSYGRSTGIGDLVDTSREHGRSAVSMETMDSYRFTCEEGPGP
ncbi:uncharacterized protein UHOD_12003 [Ustilago sp. UG-2017b]|nr:uncharacterized protein UHOD_12003 [Ustilago sp. UG-2017b]